MVARQRLGSGRRGQVRCEVLAIWLPVELGIRSLFHGRNQSTSIRVSPFVCDLCFSRHAAEAPAQCRSPSSAADSDPDGRICRWVGCFGVGEVEGRKAGVEEGGMAVRSHSPLRWTGVSLLAVSFRGSGDSFYAFTNADSSVYCTTEEILQYNARKYVRLLVDEIRVVPDALFSQSSTLLLPCSSISPILSASPARGVVVDRAADRPDPKSQLRRRELWLRV